MSGGVDSWPRKCHGGGVFKRLGKYAIVLALVCAVGGHWVLLQTFAWVSMTISFSRTDALDTAIVKTLSGENPCDLCHFVAEGKKSERAKEAFKVETKLELISSPGFVLATPAEREIQFSVPVFTAYSRGDAPPSPPPRVS